MLDCFTLKEKCFSHTGPAYYPLSSFAFTFLYRALSKNKYCIITEIGHSAEQFLATVMLNFVKP
jgi:hypothetical protein